MEKEMGKLSFAIALKREKKYTLCIFYLQLI